MITENGIPMPWMKTPQELSQFLVRYIQSVQGMNGNNIIEFTDQELEWIKTAMVSHFGAA